MRLSSAHDHVQVLQVRPHRAGDARVLDLDGDLAAVAQRRAVDLPDRGRRDRLLLEGREHLGDRLFQVVLDHAAHLLEGHRRRGVAQLGELALELLAVLLGDEADVEERHHLAELHRRALHRPEHRDDLLGGLQLAARHRLLGGLLAAGDVRRAGAELLDGLARRERGDRRGAARARGRDLLVLARHALHARSVRRGASGALLSRMPLDARARARCRRSRPASAPRPSCRRRSRRRAAPAWRAGRARCTAASPRRRGRARRG